MRSITQRSKERLAAIVRCVDEIHVAASDQRAGNWGALLGEMDARRELHRLLFEETR